LKGTGISVTALCPGPTATGFQKAANFNASRLIKLMKSASAREVAEYGYTAMMKGKRIAIPGVLNMIGSTLPRILPRRLVTFILHKIQDTTKK
jgi:short-subunit dehydrogenase